MTGTRKAGKKYYVIPVMTSGRNMSYGSFGEQCREHHGGSGMAGTLTIKNANKDSRAAY